MDALIFTDHARKAMAADLIPEEGVYHAMGDADDILEYDNERTEYVGVWDKRVFSVILEDDGEAIVTVFERKRMRGRRRRR